MSQINYTPHGKEKLRLFTKDNADYYFSYFRYSEHAVTDPYANDLPDYWIEKPVSLFFEDNVLKLVCDVHEVEATHSVKSVGIYTNDGIMVFYTNLDYPLLSHIHQRFVIELTITQDSLTDPDSSDIWLTLSDIYTEFNTEGKPLTDNIYNNILPNFITQNLPDSLVLEGSVRVRTSYTDILTVKNAQTVFGTSFNNGLTLQEVKLLVSNLFNTTRKLIDIDSNNYVSEYGTHNPLTAFTALKFDSRTYVDIQNDVSNLQAKKVDLVNNEIVENITGDHLEVYSVDSLDSMKYTDFEKIFKQAAFSTLDAVWNVNISDEDNSRVLFIECDDFITHSIHEVLNLTVSVKSNTSYETPFSYKLFVFSEDGTLEINSHRKIDQTIPIRASHQAPHLQQLYLIAKDSVGNFSAPVRITINWTTSSHISTIRTVDHDGYVSFVVDYPYIISVTPLVSNQNLNLVQVSDQVVDLYQDGLVNWVYFPVLISEEDEYGNLLSRTRKLLPIEPYLIAALYKASEKFTHIQTFLDDIFVSNTRCAQFLESQTCVMFSHGLSNSYYVFTDKVCQHINESTLCSDKKLLPFLLHTRIHNTLIGSSSSGLLYLIQQLDSRKIKILKLPLYFRNSNITYDHEHDMFLICDLMSQHIYLTDLSVLKKYRVNFTPLGVYNNVIVGHSQNNVVICKFVDTYLETICTVDIEKIKISDSNIPLVISQDSNNSICITYVSESNKLIYFSYDYDQYFSLTPSGNPSIYLAGSFGKSSILFSYEYESYIFEFPSNISSNSFPDISLSDFNLSVTDLTYTPQNETYNIQYIDSIPVQFLYTDATVVYPESEIFSTQISVEKRIFSKGTKISKQNIDANLTMYAGANINYGYTLGVGPKGIQCII